MALYSVRLLSSATANGTIQFACPVGKRAILVTADAVNNTTAAAQFHVMVAGVYIARTSVPANGWFHLETRLVFYATELMQIWTDVPALNRYTCGYLFDDPAAPLAGEGLVEEGFPLEEPIPVYDPSLG